jgi:TolA-binding protein
MNLIPFATLFKPTGVLRRGVTLWLGLALAGTFTLRLPAAAPSESDAFDRAAAAFNDGFFERAESEFSGFIRKYPASERAGEALLLQAQSRFKLKQYDAVVRLLEPQLTRPGKWADKYRYWLAEAQFQQGHYPAAVATYSQLVKDFPDSSVGPDACYGEAMAWYKMGNLTNVVDLLRQPHRTFQKFAQALPNEPAVVRGFLLLASALLLEKEYRAAEDTLNRLANRHLAPELDWERLYLLIRVQLADLRPEAARQSVTNLLTLTATAGLRNLQPETVELHGEILQKINRLDDATRVYEQNLAEGVPYDQRRQALLRIIDLSLAQNRTTQAVQWLETFTTEHPQDPLMDLTRLNLGELRLKMYYALRDQALTNRAVPPALTNLLHQAETQFDLLITNYARSASVPKAYLDRGWCLWEAGKFPESLAAFTNAAARLPLSEDQAMAQLKVADAQYQLKNVRGACQTYHRILETYGSLPGLPSSIIEQALSQTAVTGVELSDLPVAIEALNQMLARCPVSPLTERALLRVGQLCSRLGKPLEARGWLEDLKQRFPNSKLWPEAQLDLARAYAQESNWPEALARYDRWITQYTNHPFLPQAAFDRAWVSYQAQQETNAFQLFTNFVVRFRTHELAPLAQFWVGDFYYRRGEYVKAEENYQKGYQETNWPVTALTYQMRLMAGQAAFARASFEDSARHFTNLIELLKSPTSPTNLLPEVYFRYGDTIVELSPPNATNPVNRFAEAILAFDKIPDTSRLAARKWARIGDCNAQYSTRDPQDPLRYTNAIVAYQKAMDSPLADTHLRCLAEIGLAKVLENWWAHQPTNAAAPKIELLDNAQEKALQHYLNVVYTNAVPAAGETPDLFSLEIAGREAARLVEARQNWDQALRLYERLAEALPARRSFFEKRLAAVKSKLKD